MNASLPVPARAHFLWTGAGFSLAQRLAIDSVRLTNPQLELHLHLIGEVADTDELRALAARPEVSLRRRTARDVLAPCGDAVWRTYQRIPAGAASAQSNLLRYAVLLQEGGIYLDLDIFALRSLTPLRAAPCTLGAELVWRADEARVAGELSWAMVGPTTAFGLALALRHAESATGLRLPRACHRWLEPRWALAQPNNAVIAAAPGAEFVRALLERAPEVDATVRFRLGPTLVSEIARARPETVTVVPPAVLYWVPPSQSFRLFREPTLTPPAEGLLVHYVASNHRRELAELAAHGPAGLRRSLVRALAEAVLAGRPPMTATAAAAS